MSFLLFLFFVIRAFENFCSISIHSPSRASLSQAVTSKFRVRSEDYPREFNCRDGGEERLTWAPLVQARRKLGERRVRKITPKRCGRHRREFSECCNRHEWGLIDDPLSSPPGPFVLLVRRFYKFSLHASQPARAANE